MNFKTIIKQYILKPQVLLIMAVGVFTILSTTLWAQVAPTVNTTISVYSDGSAPFDANTWDGVTFAGEDADASGTNDINGVVRIQDSVIYKIEASVNDADVDELVATVTLDGKQEWGSIPGVCLLSGVTTLSEISSDGQVLTCNLGSASEGSIKSFFPEAKIVGYDVVNDTAVLNDDIISASVSVSADGSVSNTEVSEETTVTAGFAVDLEYYTNNANPAYFPGPSGEAGMVVTYKLRARYQNGSMLADPDANPADFEASYTLIDYYTDEKAGTDTGLTLSSNALLYTWGGISGCEFIGDHGVNATIDCTENTAVDLISPTIAAPFGTTDGVADPNFTIQLDNIDVRDPEGDNNLFEANIRLWVPRTDIETGCALAPCSLDLSTEVAQYAGGVVSSFSPVSIEDASATNLPNFGVSDEPLVDNRYDEIDIEYRARGVVGGQVTFDTISTAKARVNEDVTYSPGQIIPLATYMNKTDLTVGTDYTMQGCVKIDTNNLEYYGLATVPPVSTLGWSVFDATPYNPAYGSAVGGTLSDYRWVPAPTDQYTILYTDSPNGTGSLVDLGAARCQDDSDGDTIYNIKNADGSYTTSAADSVDWYENPDDVPGGYASITRIRTEALMQDDDVATTYPEVADKYVRVYVNFHLKVKETAVGYADVAGVDWVPVAMDNRRKTTGNFTGWTSGIGSLDTNDVAIGTSSNGAFLFTPSTSDRFKLEISSQSIAKSTSPIGVTTVRGGDLLDLVLEPKVSGVWAGPQEVTVSDDLYSQFAYVAGSEMFSNDNGLTWLDLADYLALVPDVTTTLAANAAGADPVTWVFDNVESGEVLPLIKYTIEVNPTITSGAYVSVATIASAGVIDTNKTYSHTLTVTPEYGLDILKIEGAQVVPMDTAFTYDMTYKNLGGEDYINGGVFIDVLPFNGDETAVVGGLLSTRSPGTTYNGIYAPAITADNAEVFYATDADPTTIHPDPCHESNTTVVTTTCPIIYDNNAEDVLVSGGTATTPIVWNLCTGSDLTTCALTDTDITAIKFETGSIEAATGSYTVTLELTPTDNIGGTPFLDVDGKVMEISTGDIYTNSFGGRIPEISLMVISSDATTTVEAGEITGTVWSDANQDGINDGENGLAGITVTLYDDLGVVVATTTTNSDGSYAFLGINLGTYEVVVTDPGSLFSQTYDHDDVDASAPLTPLSTGLTISFASPELIENINFGFYESSSRSAHKRPAHRRTAAILKPQTIIDLETFESWERCDCGEFIYDLQTNINSLPGWSVNPTPGQNGSTGNETHCYGFYLESSILKLQETYADLLVGQTVTPGVYDDATHDLFTAILSGATEARQPNQTLIGSVEKNIIHHDDFIPRVEGNLPTEAIAAIAGIVRTSDVQPTFVQRVFSSTTPQEVAIKKTPLATSAMFNDVVKEVGGGQDIFIEKVPMVEKETEQKEFPIVETSKKKSFWGWVKTIFTGK